MSRFHQKFFGKSSFVLALASTLVGLSSQAQFFNGNIPLSRTSDGRLHIEYEACHKSLILSPPFSECEIELVYITAHEGTRTYVTRTFFKEKGTGEIKEKYFRILTDNSDYANGMRSIAEENQE